MTTTTTITLAGMTASEIATTIDAGTNTTQAAIAHLESKHKLRAPTARLLATLKAGGRGKVAPKLAKAKAAAADRRAEFLAGVKAKCKAARPKPAAKTQTRKAAKASPQAPANDMAAMKAQMQEMAAMVSKALGA